ncbi:MAG: hypothetical protein QOK49_3503, partial [Baekduia sp.]|nr:hypothetical protein [Baekduia sp.]
EILRVTNADGRCGGPDPASAGLGGGLISTTVTIRPSAAALIAEVAGAPSACSASRRLTLRIRRRGGVRLVAISVYLHGKRLVSIGAPRRVPQTVKLAGLPRGRFTLRIHARTSKGKLIKVTRHFAACRAPTSR